ncbi:MULTISPECIES: filamentous hemagglutinin N-terminal domain-containing protein [Pandoraea]|uniref:beta strand repeat-containing protein n=1 Tax=Pandoraea TaxID=93217 RepID=UPI001F5CB803|nr:MULTISPECIES: filamentous hemagglutinin N-terminal domain-containing protein [Pandoraea]MCI3203379.1 adhesin [Pandoraea sp. LA3]MDN4581405.1 adhesin [Pandoraea capi]
MKATSREIIEVGNHARQSTEVDDGTPLPGLDEKPAIRLWQRVIAACVALTLLVSPISVTFELSQSAARELAANRPGFDETALTVLRSLATLRVHVGMREAMAAPITDPTAPVVFAPKITTSGAGVPVVNITAPNAAGISLNQYQSFNVDAAGLILNNSLLNGTSLNGGAIAANPNLTGRTASTIVNQVTSSGSAYASALNGPLEVFGAPATVIIANPNGISVRGAGFTNTIGVTLTTGTPQFLTGPGGTPTDFTNATALGYNVISGHIQLEGNAGVNGPGSGIEGTVGSIDLIGQTVGVNAPLYAGTRINVITGNQQVLTGAVDGSGTRYVTAANGAANTAQAVQSALANGGNGQAFAIDATRFGAMTAGQIQVIGTTAGLGVRMAGDLASTAGDLTLSSGGDLTVANHAAQQQVQMTSGGNVALTGTGLGETGYRLTATGDVSSTGSLQSGKAMDVRAGGNLTLANLQSNDSTTLNAGMALTLKEAQVGGDLSLATQDASLGDIRLTGPVTVAGTLAANAARSLVVTDSTGANGNVTVVTGGDFQIAQGARLTGHSAVSTQSIGDTRIDGTLASGAQLDMTAKGGLDVQGDIASTGTARLSADGTLNVDGTLLGQADAALHAGTDITGKGKLAFGTNAVLRADRDVSLTGALLAGVLDVEAKNSLSLNDVQSTGTAALRALGMAGGGDIALQGKVSFYSAAALDAARDILINGTTAGGDAVTLNAARNVGVAGSLQTAGTTKTLSITAGNAITVPGAIEASADLKANAGTTLDVAGSATAAGDVNLQSGGDLRVAGNVSGQRLGTIDAGGNLDITGGAHFLGNTSLTSGANATLSGKLQTANLVVTSRNAVTLGDVQAGGTLDVTANGLDGSGDIRVAGPLASFGVATLRAARDMLVTSTGSIAANDKLNVTGGRDLRIDGGVTAVGDVAMTASSGNLSTTANLSTNSQLTLNAGQTVMLGAPQTSAIGNASVTAGQDIVLSGALVGLAGVMQAGRDLVGAGASAFTDTAKLSANRDVNLSGVLQGNGVSVTAGNSATVSSVTSNGAFTVSASGNAGGGDVVVNGTSNVVGGVQASAARDVTVAGTLATGDTATLTGARDVNVTGTLQAAKDIVLTATQGSVNQQGKLGVGNRLGVSAGTDVAMSGETVVSGDTTLTSGRDTIVTGTINGQGTGRIDAGRDVSGAGTASFTGAFDVSATRDVAHDGLLQGGGLTITAGNNVAVRNAESTAALTLTANGLAGGGDIAVNGGTGASGVVSLKAARDIGVTGTLGGGGTTTLDAQRDIKVTGAIQSVGDALLTARGGSVLASGGISGGGNVSIGAAQDVALGASTSALRDIAVNAGRDLQLGAVLVGVNANLTAGRTLLDAGDGSGKAVFTGTATLVSAGDTKLTGGVQANGIDVTVGGNATLGVLNSAAGIKVTTTGTAGAQGVLGGPGDIVFNGAVSSPNAFSATAARDVLLAGSVTCGAACELIAQRNLSVTGSALTLGDLSLLTRTGDLAISGDITTAGTLLATSGGNASLGGKLNVQGDLRASAANDLTLAGQTSVQGIGALRAGNDINGDGTTVFGGDVTLNAGRNTALTGTLSGKNVDIHAANDAGLHNVQATQSLTVTADGTAGGGDVSVSGDAVALGTVTMTGARDVSVTGKTVGGDNVALTATSGDIRLQGDTASERNLTLSASNGAISTGNVGAQGDLTVNAGKSLTMQGDTTANGLIRLTSGGDMTLGNVRGVAADVADAVAGVLKAGGNLNATSLTFGNGGLTTTSGKATQVTGAVVAGNALTMSTSGDLSVGSVQAGKSAALTAGGTGDVRVTGDIATGNGLTIGAGRDVVLGGAVTAGDGVTVTAARDLSVVGALSANQDIALTAAGGNLTLAGPITAIKNFAATAGGALALGSAQTSGQTVGQINGDTTLTSGGTMTLNGHLIGKGLATLQSGGDIAGTNAALTFGKDVAITSGGKLTLGSVDTAGDLGIKAQGDASLGALTSMGKLTLSSTAGGLTLGKTLVGGTLDATAATYLSALQGVSSMGAMTLTAQSGNLSAVDVSGNDTVTLHAGQTLTMGGTNTVVGDMTLTGGNVVITGATTASKVFTATATDSLDASGGQLFVTNGAKLAGARIDTGAMIVGGSLDVTATQWIRTHGLALINGATTFDAGTGTFTNSTGASVLSAGPLSIRAGNIVNQSGGQLASTKALTLNATGNITNAGLMNGDTTSVTGGGTLTNSGTLLGANGVTLNVGGLNNNGGMILAGDVTSATPASADLALTVNGSDTVTTAGGELAATRNLAASMRAATFDVTGGALQAGGTMSITANAINNTGMLQLGGANVSLTGLASFINSGTIQGNGALTLSSNGWFTNIGSVIGGSDVTVNAALINGAGATIHADRDLSLTGDVVNSGVIEANRNLSVTGGNFSNIGAKTQAAGDITFNMPGTLNNIGGTIIAGNNLTVNAGAVVNDQAAGSGAVTTTTTVVDPSLIWSAVIGMRSSMLSEGPGGGEGDMNVRWKNVSATATLGDLLSPTGVTLEGKRGDVNPWTGDLCWGIGGPNACNAGTAEPVTGSGTFYMNKLRGSRMVGDNAVDYDYWQMSGAPIPGAQASVAIALPTVNQTSTVMQMGAAGVMIAGGDISLTTANLSNKGGQIAAGRSMTLNVGSLSNGAVSPTTTSNVVNSVDQGQYSTFLAQLASLGAIEVPAYLNENLGDEQQAHQLVSFSIATGSAAPTSTSTISWSTSLGLITAANTLNLYGGNLVNEGMIYAQNNVNIYAASVTNQGGNTQQFSSQAGCAAGTSNIACYRGNDVRGQNPNTTSFTFAQNNAAIIAGNNLTIAAGTINNKYGDLIAGHDLVIGGVGSSATGTTAADSLTNTSGNILAGNNLTLNVAGGITNTLPPPVQVHENYGKLEKYSGCMTAGGYKESYCEAYVDQQSGNSSIIGAGNNLTINAGSLTNVGSLITAGLNATINVSGPVVNSAQTLNAYWHSHWVQETGMFESDKRHDVWSCGSAAECTSLYGDAYTSVGGVINPPTPVGNIAATIQAPNLTVTSGGQIVNVGNVVGQSVSLTGTSLVNGITTANTYTPQVGNAPQVISLAPANGGLNLTIPASLGGAGSSILTGTTGQQNGPSYIVGGLGATLDPVSPQVLLSNLPASLQPSTTTFYFSPQQEAIQLQQAALTQTGKASFINGLSTDSTSQLTVNDQQKLVLYGNAVEYAKTNNIQLGQALTPEQVAGLSQPMLWYVEQTVPEPGCAATGNAKCPTVTALMPQVYLPENFTALSAGGQILASNDLSLNFGSTATGGSILNTGSITSGGSLTVNTGTLTNRANVVDVGEIWSYIKDTGYLKTTGTMVQPGGFMSAAAGGLTLNVDQFNQIGGALQLLGQNGEVDQAATQAFIAGVAAQLGDNFVQQTLQNDLHTDFVKQGGSFGIQQVGMIMAAAMTGAALGPLFSGMIAAQLGTTAATFVAGGLGNVMASAALTAMTSSTLTQVVFNGTFDLGSVLKTGLSAAVTAGLLNGITLKIDDSGMSLGVTGKVSSDSLSSLAGVKPTFVDGAVSQAGATSVGSSLTQGVAIFGQSVIQAGVQSTIQGGSFLDALKASGVSNLSAALAYQIGSLGAATLGQTGYVGAHAVLGCAASAAVGSGCAGGAIGAGVSALVADDVARAVTDGKGVTDPAQLAIIASATQLLSAMIAGAIGASPNAAATAAQNETLNNACAPGHECGTFTSAATDAVRATANAGLGIAEAVPNLLGGALPGFPDYVPFLDKYKLAYDDPDFGELASFLLSLGIARAVGYATRPTSAANTAEGTANSVSGARLSMQLSAEQAAGARAPTSISSYSDHAIQQIAGRDGGIGVSRAAVNDAFANPTAIQYVPSKYGPTFKYVGQNATVVVNPQGNVVTTWGTSAAGVKR